MEASQAVVEDHPSVLIVEDEPITRLTLATLLAGVGYVTDAVQSAEIALEHIGDGDRPEIALVDLDLPGMNGADFISKLVAEHPEVFPVLISAASAERVASLQNPPQRHLRKPLDFKELVRVLASHGRSH